MNPCSPIVPFCVSLSTTFLSCVGTASTREVQCIDSLNQLAYTYRYRNLDSSCRAASQAYKKISMYQQGKAKAFNNLASCTFMRIDPDNAERLYKEVYSPTKNELELLIADIELVKIYQRIAMGKEFYDYRNSATRRMKRIDEESNLFIDRHEGVRLNYALTEFFIVPAVYHYYL